MLASRVNVGQGLARSRPPKRGVRKEGTLRREMPGLRTAPGLHPVRTARTHRATIRRKCPTRRQGGAGRAGEDTGSVCVLPMKSSSAHRWGRAPVGAMISRPLRPATSISMLRCPGWLSMFSTSFWFRGAAAGVARRGRDVCRGTAAPAVTDSSLPWSLCSAHRPCHRTLEVVRGSGRFTTPQAC